MTYAADTDRLNSEEKNKILTTVGLPLLINWLTS